MKDLETGNVERTLDVNDFAKLLFIHPTHLSNTINQVLKKSPCDIYEEKLLNLAKWMILSSDLPIAEIARRLTYDPSNFGKFFKRYAGITPIQFRQANKKI
ncbi:MAG: AraC family transcriptional regulator [Chitinophagales bacterium]